MILAQDGTWTISDVPAEDAITPRFVSGCAGSFGDVLKVSTYLQGSAMCPRPQGRGHNHYQRIQIGLPSRSRSGSSVTLRMDRVQFTESPLAAAISSALAPWDEARRTIVASFSSITSSGTSPLARVASLSRASAASESELIAQHYLPNRDQAHAPAPCLCA